MYDGDPEGAVSPNGLVAGTLLHGIFTNRKLVSALYEALSGEDLPKPPKPYEELVERSINMLKDAVLKSLDKTLLSEILGVSL